MAINQRVTLAASADAVYKALTSATEFGQVTGAPAEIESVEGSAFSCFGGQVTGRQIELVPNKRIVQAWRVGAWDEGVYSIVKFDIVPTGDSTTLDLAHAGFPDDSKEHLEAGWHKMYWDPLTAYFD